MAKGRGLRNRYSAEKLLKRTEEAHGRVDDYGKFGRFYKAPPGSSLKTWKCKEGEHLIDIIPFLAGKNHHHTEEGEPTYLVDIWIHQKVGSNENDMVCLARNYGEPCPICEWINQKRLGGDISDAQDNALKVIGPKRRCIYNVICYDSTREEDRGVQVWEIAHFLFEKKILAIARNPRGGGFVPFSSPDTGSSIYFEREGSGMTNTQYLGHKFVERDAEITDEILEAAYVLDELITKPTYEDLKEAFQSGVAAAGKKSSKREQKAEDPTEEEATGTSRLERAKAGRAPAEEEPEDPAPRETKKEAKPPARKQKAETKAKEPPKPPPQARATGRRKSTGRRRVPLR